MKLENIDLQQEFYDCIQQEYPNMTFEEVRECISYPYLYTRQNIQNGKLPVIRLTYFGTFIVFKRKAESMLVIMKNRFDKLKLDAKDYFRYKSMLERFLEKYEAEDIDFRDNE